MQGLIPPEKTERNAVELNDSIKVAGLLSNISGISNLIFP